MLYFLAFCLTIDTCKLFTILQKRRVAMSLTDRINSLLLDLGKFAYEHWFTYWLVIVCVAAGGVLSVLLSWAFAVFVPLFILFVGFVARNKYKKTIG